MDGDDIPGSMNFQFDIQVLIGNFGWEPDRLAVAGLEDARSCHEHMVGVRSSRVNTRIYVTYTALGIWLRGLVGAG